MEKLKKIVELLNGKGQVLIRNEGKSQWYVHCWLESQRHCKEFDSIESYLEQDIYSRYVTDLDSALDEIIEKLEDK